MPKPDIKLRWNKRENDIEVQWEAGHKHTGLYMLDLFNKDVQKELRDRGYDLTTIKFSINKKNASNE